MIENQLTNPGHDKDHNSEFLLKIMNKTSMEEQTNNEKELYVDENWKINADFSQSIKSDENLELKEIFSKLFPNKKITVTNNKDGSQTIILI